MSEPACIYCGHDDPGDLVPSVLNDGVRCEPWCCPTEPAAATEETR